jgi:hypothetical protein
VRRVARIALAAAALWVLLLPGAAASAAAELPLGPRSLDERRSGVSVAPGVRWTRIVREGGPWRVNVLSVAPGARALVTPATGGPERPSAMARRARAVAAVNGGYFDGDGYPAGVLAAGGRLLSEPVGGRSALVLEPLGIAPLRFGGLARVGGAPRLLDGVNRIPGEIPACGGRGGDRPTQRPNGALTCTDPGELVLFTPEWGARTPAGLGRADTVVRGGVVGVTRPRGGTRVPADGVVLGGTGDAARLLRDTAVAGTPVELDLALRARRSVLVAGPAGVVGGGPRLVAGGRVRIRAGAEGFAPLSAPWFAQFFVASRQPRTLAGVRGDGRLLLVTVDGRRPGWSAGVTLREAARLMRSLGARDALNLDGGGSTAMAVRGRTVNRPSDAGGERPVSDALLVLP